MPSAGVPFASLSQRGVAFGINLLVVGGVFGVAYCAPGFPSSGSAEFQVVLWLTFFIYQAGSVLHPNLDLGRFSQGIRVVSLQGSGTPTFHQATVRAAARTTLAVCAVVMHHRTGSEVWFFLAASIELVAAYTSSNRQTLADNLAGTLVLRTPPVQPHRAPAAPMFSSKEKDFGSRENGEG